MMPSSVNCTVIGLKFTNACVQGQTYLFIVHERRCSLCNWNFFVMEYFMVRWC